MSNGPRDTAGPLATVLSLLGGGAKPASPAQGIAGAKVKTPAATDGLSRERRRARNIRGNAMPGAH